LPLNCGLDSTVPVTDPLSGKRFVGFIAALAESSVDCGEPKKLQGFSFYAIHLPDSLSSELARFAYKDGELP
jgi:hypothetical protein